MDNYAVALATKGKINEALAVIDKKLKMEPRDLQSYQLLINIYRAVGDKAREQQAISKAKAIERELNEEQGGQ
jgi:two-component SAPR family response regulator